MAKGSKMVSSYSSIFNLGHKAIQELMGKEVNVEEKVDGSQISWTVDPDSLLLHVRSKNAEIHLDNPGMFNHAVANLNIAYQRNLFIPGYTYRGEYLSKPKHNALKYERTPINNVIIYDIETTPSNFMLYEDKFVECERIGFECVPLLWRGILDKDAITVFQKLIETTDSKLHGAIEGVVIKPTNYDLFGIDKKLLIAKLVSDSFKEVHREAWKGANTGTKDIIELLGVKYRTDARWRKCIQHLRDAGQLEFTPRDIGKVIKEIETDITRETSEEIKADLWNWANKQLMRKVSSGAAEFYKSWLLEESMKGDADYYDSET